MTEYTPNEADVRDTYGVGWNPMSRPEALAPHDVFSRWLAAHDAEVRADERAKRPDREQVAQFATDVMRDAMNKFGPYSGSRQGAHIADALMEAGYVVEPEAREEPLIDCPHWEPGRLTKRKGCTACAAEAREVTDAQANTARRVLDAHYLIPADGPDPYPSEVHCHCGLKFAATSAGWREFHLHGPRAALESAAAVTDG